MTQKLFQSSNKKKVYVQLAPGMISHLRFPCAFLKSVQSGLSEGFIFKLFKMASVSFIYHYVGDGILQNCLN